MANTTKFPGELCYISSSGPMKLTERTMTNTSKTNDNVEAAMGHINAYLKFMYNQWTEQMCKAIFGAQLSDHIWNKWVQFREDQGIEAAIFNMWFALDRKCTNKLLGAALQCYGW